MVSLILTLNAIICVALIVLILLQRSDPASGGMFGGAGGAAGAQVRNPLARPTALLAGLFLVFSILVAVLNKGGSHTSSIMAEHTAAPTAEVSSTLPQPTLAPVGVSVSAPTASPTQP